MEHSEQNENYISKKYHINPEYVLRELAGEYVIIPIGTECVITNAVMSPNDTAVFIWKEFQSSQTVEDIVKKGLEEYDVTEEILRDAVYRFVMDGIKYQFLEEEE